MTNQQQPKEPTISMPFGRFIHKYYFGDLFDKIDEDDTYAHIIEALNAQLPTPLVHVEYPCSENTLVRPRVWRYTVWKESYDKWVKDKERSARERLEANLYHENKDLLVRALVKRFGLPADVVRKQAEKIALGKDTVAAGVIGVKLEVMK
jgi:hypothetical protein